MDISRPIFVRNANICMDRLLAERHPQDLVFYW